MRSTRIAISIVLLAAAFGAGYLVRDGQNTTGAAAKPLYYACPMHPQVRSAKPGDAPCCGMKLEPVYASGRQPGAASSLTEAQMRLAGVVVEPVGHAEAAHPLRLAGRVAPDEARTYRLNAAVDGWVRRMAAPTTGSFVRKGEHLVWFYSPEFLSTQQALIFAAMSLQKVQAPAGSGDSQVELFKINIKSSEETLRNMGMEDQQIAEIIQTLRPVDTIEVTSPADGILLARNLTPGQRFDKSTEMFRIANLDRVWVTADLWEQESDLVAPGTAATVHWSGKTFRARRSEVSPQFDASTRALRVRFELDNPGSVLRPDMLVEVEVPVQLPGGVSVPAGALLDTGMTQTVYVEKSQGSFEPRAVETSWRRAGLVGIRRGLAAGERIVTSGTFLIDSDSRMRRAGVASAPAPGTSKDPVCGMDVDPAKAAGKTEYKGQTILFCSPGCKQSFDRDPARYLSDSAHAGASHD